MCQMGSYLVHLKATRWEVIMKNEGKRFWWLVELPISLLMGFFKNILGIFPCQVKNNISCKMRLSPCEVGMKWTSENWKKLKIPVWLLKDLCWPSVISYQLFSHPGSQPLPEITEMTPITHRINMTIYNKTKHHQDWINLQLWHFISHLGWQPLPEFTQVAAISHRVNIKTCNQNQTPSLGQSSALTCFGLTGW